MVSLLEEVRSAAYMMAEAVNAVENLSEVEDSKLDDLMAYAAADAKRAHHHLETVLRVLEAVALNGARQ